MIAINTRINVLQFNVAPSICIHNILFWKVFIIIIIVTFAFSIGCINEDYVFLPLLLTTFWLFRKFSLP